MADMLLTGLWGWTPDVITVYCRAGYDAHLKFNHVLYINLQLNMTSFRDSGECLTYIFAYQNQTVLFCIENEINRKNCFH